MNVPNIEIGTGSLTTLPRADVNGPTPPSPSERSARSTSETSTSSISLTRLAWFDANGDGQIDPRAAGSGGDATLLVPTHQVDLPTYGRVAHPAPGSRPAAGKAASAVGEPDRNPAQTQRAVAAYERYGQAPAAPPSVAAAPSAPSAPADASSVTPGRALSAVA